MNIIEKKIWKQKWRTKMSIQKIPNKKQSRRIFWGFVVRNFSIVPDSFTKFQVIRWNHHTRNYKSMALCVYVFQSQTRPHIILQWLGWLFVSRPSELRTKGWERCGGASAGAAAPSIINIRNMIKGMDHINCYDLHMKYIILAIWLTFSSVI